MLEEINTPTTYTGEITPNSLIAHLSSQICTFVICIYTIVSENKELPAVHLSIDELKEIEELLRENTTNCKTEIILSLPGGVERKYHSVSQIDSTVLADVGGSNSYSLSIVGEEGRCMIAGESTGIASHMLYCAGPPDWRDKIQYSVMEYLNSVQTIKDHLRSRLTGKSATTVAVLASLFVGWAVAAVAPQSVIHYFPKLLDAIIFTLGIFGLLIIRFRNWVHPYILIGHGSSYPTKRRIELLAAYAVLITFCILVFRWLIEPGPFLR